MEYQQGAALISVIIPVYNIASYLPRCVRSVLEQSYRNLDIILVDDGSTDESGALCDAYGQSDPRIRVIHKKNGGLSDARNCAISLARGEYILFVDGDDFLEREHICYLYQDITAHRAQIACCSFCNADQRQEGAEKSKSWVLSPEEAVETMFYGKDLEVSAWAKLYHRSLFEEIRYPIGRLYEDLGTTYKLFFLARRIACARDRTYCYVQRAGSIVHSCVDQAHLEAYGFLREFEERIHPDQRMKRALASRALILSMEFMRTGALDAHARKVVWAHVLQNRRYALSASGAPIRVRAFAVMSWLGYGCTSRLLRLYDQYRSSQCG